VVLPILLLAGLRIALLDRFPVTHNLTWDWYNHAVSLGMFLMGYAIARHAALFDRLAALRFATLALGLGAWAFYAWYGWVYWRDGSPQPGEVLRMVARTAYAVEQWCMILAVLGFARRHFNHSSPLLRYLSVGVFPFYIIHQTLIVVIGHNLKALSLPVGVESALIIAATVGGCLATYELARRVRVLGPLLGVK
jgi:surface polysaccharide O-acyltransferase-like enzyme